ncbi:MAG: class I SAM-dependent methyltransferase [Gammaproteobacteria bacterium]
MKKIDAQSWSFMWETPSFTTFGSTDFAENYDGAILEFWESQLKGELKQVIDLACGNGALTWIANDLLNDGEQQTAITGVDFADIEPFKRLGRKEEDYPAISFIGNCPIEKLPFEDDSVDLAISQYGLEYSDLDQSIPEIARVLGPTGKMSFIVHAREGDLVKGATLPLEDYRKMLDVIRLDELILKLARFHDKGGSARAKTQSDEYRELVDRIESMRGVFQAIAQRYPEDTTVDGYTKKLEHALGEATKKRSKRKTDVGKFLADARNVLRMAIERKEDLIAASLTQQEVKELVSRIKKEGFTVTEKRKLIHAGNLNWGTIVVAERAPAGGLIGATARRIGSLIRRPG